MSSSSSLLLVIDAQKKLMPAIHNSVSILHRSAVLLDVARRMAIPRVISEHCSNKIGCTLPFISSVAGEHQIIDKTHFSVADEPNAMKDIAAYGKRQLIIVGAEAHICVLQTAMGFASEGFEVFLVKDAIGSRNPDHVDEAIQRAALSGIHTVNTEMVIFEWLQRADSEQFKQSLPVIKRLSSSPDSLEALELLFG
ncbi:hypothetical protein A8L45_02675 [Veronia pacifica]|uniref:Isochorismatase-like domain-containing protein n=2 Tax=Veronia pacifica TaxID=1080227 RepID=A0A1C3ERV9_9GAMM|nr:hypothetical protein A8L45_02675 [Veronia pacifica]